MHVPVHNAPDPGEPPRFRTPQQIALICGLSTDAIYRAIERGDLTAVRLCSRLRIHDHDFQEWMRSNTTGPSTQTEPDTAAS